MSSQTRTPPRRRLLRAFVAVIGVVVVAVVLAVVWDRVAFVREEVRFDSGDVTLAGTLTRSRFGGEQPAVVLIHGSGERTRRSMSIFARIFAYRGHASLAYDKRGVGQSEGDPTAWEFFSFEDLAGDAAAGYDFLRGHPAIDRSRIGFLGASQGGWVAPLAAERVSSGEGPAFLIAISASVSTVAEDRLFGREARARHVGVDEDGIADAVALQELDHRVTRTGEGFEAYSRAWDELERQPWFSDVFDPGERRPVDDPYRAWERTVLDYDPVPLLEELDVPTLWVFGDPEFDRFSPVALSTARVEAMIRDGKDHEITTFDDVDHDLEVVDGGAVKTFVQVHLPLQRRVFGWLDERRTP